MVTTNENYFTQIASQSREIFKLATPVSFGFILQYTLGLASVFSLGHVGTTELASASLATMWVNVSGFSVGLGLASALDTLCSQAHTGSSDPYILGKHLQRSFLIMFIFCIPIWIFWWFTEEVMLLLGQTEDIARMTGEYIRYLMPGLLPVFLYDSMKRFLQNQGIMTSVIFVVSIVSPINMFLQWLLVWSPIAIGFKGAAVATMISYCLEPVLIWVYIRYVLKDGWAKWGGFDAKECFDLAKIWEYLRLGIPGSFLLCSEWWAFEIIALSASFISEEALAAQTVAMTSINLAYMVPLGLGVASSTLVGNALGANSPKKAKRVAQASYIVGFVVSGISSLFFILIRQYWGRLWTSDEKVIEIIANVMPIASIFQLADGMNSVGSGILRGIGKQKVGAVGNLFAFYVIGIPLAEYTCFSLNWNLFGLWVGITVALVLVFTLIFLWTLKLDWVVLAKTCSEKLARESDERTSLLNNSNSTLSDEERQYGAIITDE